MIEDTKKLTARLRIRWHEVRTTLLVCNVNLTHTDVDTTAFICQNNKLIWTPTELQLVQKCTIFILKYNYYKLKQTFAEWTESTVHDNFKEFMQLKY